MTVYLAPCHYDLMVQNIARTMIETFRVQASLISGEKSDEIAKTLHQNLRNYLEDKVKFLLGEAFDIWPESVRHDEISALSETTFPALQTRFAASEE